MQAITVRNVNHALPAGLALLRDHGLEIAPRGKATLEIEGPVATTYLMPDEVVLFDAERDANPFFHFFEALWILAGREDVAFLAWLLPNMADYSDDGVKFHAPYGHRLRHRFGFDQITRAIDKLREDPDTRQVVMSIWDPVIDWERVKDVPCNDMIMLKIRGGALRMTVCNRSNDIVWGAYGANAVQFGTLLKYMAGRVGASVGTYTQMSDSYHVYTDLPYWNTWLGKNRSGEPVVEDPYDGHVYASVSPFLSAPEVYDGSFDTDLSVFFEIWDSQKTFDIRRFSTDSFVEVALPMLQTLLAWRSGDKQMAMKISEMIMAPDWRMGAQRWMQRRIDKETA